MSDLIDRQAAIDAVNAVFPVDPNRNDYVRGIACGAALAQTYIKQLPSVHPEIIRCRYCAKCQYDTLFDQYWCNGREVREDFYCGDAIRKESR